VSPGGGTGGFSLHDAHELLSWNARPIRCVVGSRLREGAGRMTAVGKLAVRTRPARSSTALDPAPTAQVDPLETVMTAPPGEPLRWKADDQVPCDRAATICA
jgi:hypothetical protein